MPLPDGFSTIVEAKPMNGQFVSLIGLVVDFQPPGKSGGSDYQATVRICDKSAALYQNHLTIRFFRPVPEELPQDMDIGQTIIVMRNIKIGDRNGPIGMSNKSRSSWVSLKGEMPARRKPKQNNRPERPTIRLLDNGPRRIEDVEEKKNLLSPEEYEAVKDLVEFWHARGGLAGSHGISTEEYQHNYESKPKRSKKAALIKEVDMDSFHDLTCYVQHTWSVSDKMFTITVTDFTENPNFYNIDNDPFADAEAGVPARDETYEFAYKAGGVTKNHETKVNKKWFEKPFGRYSLRIAVWDRLAAKARKDIREGCFITLQNVRIKRGENGNWEGSLSDGRNNTAHGDGFEILRPGDLKLKNLHARRNELERVLQEKYKEKSKKEREEIETKQQKKLEEELRRRQENNTQVHCGYVSMATTTIDQVLNMCDGTEVDFFSRHYRTECRVVDFRPSNIEDFARPIISEEDWEALSVEPNQEVMDASGRAWYWCFELDVMGKDEATLITIHVDDAAGRYLLSSKPCDLRSGSNHHVLQQLRTELFFLWGNLEEEKRKRRERLEACENKIETLMSQFRDGQDPRFLEKLYTKLEAERTEIQAFPILMHPKVSNKFFFAMIKEYGELDEEDGRFERRFILENTTVNRAIVAKNRVDESQGKGLEDRKNDYGRNFSDLEGTPRDADEMAVD
ncbi:hypothetical protein H072_1274 [Dactylellina haptotyla CBS 200.50]|uniref:Protection of telomeres protein 1 n=1 Tax=Dactylellina haptotyla (strain CBS 200.50) TaxID=1284197 RepID=S8APD7_DACHA|nr:hypothetical protein H072_1274 [Dactylellina haptotyla CBS 200.50]